MFESFFSVLRSSYLLHPQSPLPATRRSLQGALLNLSSISKNIFTPASLKSLRIRQITTCTMCKDFTTRFARDTEALRISDRYARECCGVLACGVPARNASHSDAGGPQSIIPQRFHGVIPEERGEIINSSLSMYCSMKLWRLFWPWVLPWAK